MRYLPHTAEEIERMLGVVGVGSIEELFSVIPDRLLHRGGIDLPGPLCEAELMQHLLALGACNRPQSRTTGMLVFAGAGLYSHAIPAAVDHLAGRSEFYTAYTPYQPELSQGTLLSIFEFQTLVAELSGMEVANASMYDGASATAEALLMAQRLTGRRRALLDAGLHPEYVQTCATYLSGIGQPQDLLGQVDLDDQGQVDLAALRRALDGSVAAFVVQSPNFFGVLQDLAEVAEAVHGQGALLVAVCPEPLVLALMRPPGEAGADIAVGEGIGLAGPPSLGGPGLGLLAARGKKALRAIPGRLVGQTTDSEGKPGYVLTLSTREQHIRRERATSNICTNHGLMALRFTIHLSLLGQRGFEELARLNLSKAAYARERLCALEGFAPRFGGPCFSELALRTPCADARELVRRAVDRGVVPGVPAGKLLPAYADTLLVAVNETHRREDIDRLAEVLQSAAAEALAEGAPPRKEEIP